jgi:hypothetical protein
MWTVALVRDESRHRVEVDASWQLFAVVDDGAVLMLLAGQKPRHVSSLWNDIIEQQLGSRTS